MALGTAEGQPQHGLAQGLHAVRIVIQEILCGDGATLVGHHVIALESGGNELGFRAVGHQVAGELFGEELIVGQVVVESLDDPVAPEPEVAAAINGESVGVRVAGGVQPRQGHGLPEVGAGEQAAGQLLIGQRVGIGDEGSDLRGRGWQACEVQREAADQGGPVCGGIWFQGLCREAGLDKTVNRLVRGAFRERGFFRRREGPMAGVGGSFPDPSLEEFLLGRREGKMRFGRWHQFLRVRVDDAFPCFAVGRVAGFEGDAARLVGMGLCREIEPEFAFARFFIEAVAGEAVLREDGPDIAIVVDGGTGGRQGRADSREEGQEKREAGGHG